MCGCLIHDNILGGNADLADLCEGEFLAKA